MAFSREMINKVWEKAKKIPGKDRTKYRRDPYGNPLRYENYGKNCKTGWDIDHIMPLSRGGSNNIRNLQALQVATNRKKGNTLKKKSRHNQ